jgi:hypothetical protein
MREAAMATILLLIAFVLANIQFAAAQLPGKISRIGVLFYGSRDQPHLQSFQQGLRDLGYIEGKTFLWNTAMRRETLIVLPLSQPI